MAGGHPSPVGIAYFYWRPCRRYRSRPAGRDGSKSSNMSWSNRTVLVILLCIGLVFDARAQHYYFRHYEVEDGLSNNSVFCSLVDHQGFLWFGTKDGLDRFDGYNFKVFHHDPDDSLSLGNNVIYRLYEDASGRLWVGSKRGLYRYDDTLEGFHPVRGAQNREISDICADNRGNLWFVADLNLCMLNGATGALRVYPREKYFSATSLCTTADGTLWIGTAGGYIERFDPATDSFAATSLFDKNRDLASHWIEKIYATARNTILVGTSSQGIKLFFPGRGTYRNFVTRNADGTSIYARDFVRRSGDQYWAATESGIFILDLADGTWQHVQKKFNDPYALSDNAVYSVCRDREGGIWATTYFGGVNYYSNQQISFNKYFSDGSDSAISGNAVSDIAGDRYGNLWIGTEDAGLNRYSPALGRFDHFMPDGTPHALSYSNIQCLYPSGDTLWVGTYDHGLDRMDIPTGRVVRHYEHSVRHPASFNSNFITVLYRPEGGSLLAGTWSGLYRYVPDSDKFSAVSFIPGTAHISAVYQDRGGVLWVGTRGMGVYRFDPRTATRRQFLHDPRDSATLSTNDINSIYQDGEGGLWFATEGGGLCEMRPGHAGFLRYSVKNGLPSNFTFEILEDARKNLWISTTKGLVCFERSHGIFQVYTRSNGLLTNQFNYNSAFRQDDHRFYFGSIKGLVSFDPLSFNKPVAPPPVYITGMQLFNRELTLREPHSPLKRSILFTRTISLRYNQSSFSLDFAALSYSAPGMIEYKYKMDGLEGDWTYLKTNRKAYFTQLPPGNYVFRVKAAVNGKWNGVEKDLRIIISPPFYATRAAYALYLLLAAIAVWLLVRSYHRRVEEKNRGRMALLEHLKEKEIYQAKIEFFTHIAHEIRTPLTLIKGPMEKVVRKAGDMPEIKNNLRIMEKNTDRLIDLTNQLLDFRKTEAKEFSLSFVRTNITELTRELVSSFEPLAEKKHLELTCNLPEQDVSACVDVEALKKIFINLLDNAVKYARSKIVISLFIPPQDKSLFTFEIRNDGHLIPYDMKERIFEPFFRLKETQKERGTGIGLALSRTLATLHKGIVDLRFPQQAMNVFVLTLPIEQETAFNLFDGPHDPPEKPEGQTAAEEHPDLWKPVILIVDDNEDIVEFIAEELSEHYTVLKACSGHEALSLLEKESVQLIISDIMMPVMDGLELIRRVKENFDYSHIPAILLTAKNTMQSKIEGLETGADAYIEKPFAPSFLKVQISNLLQNRRKLKEYFAHAPISFLKSMARSKSDEIFLENFNAAILDNLSDTGLDVGALARIMNISRPTLYRRIKTLSDMTPNELINLTRLKKAAELIGEGSYKIYEIAYMVGYTSQSNFGRSFTMTFGMTPSEYAKKQKDGTAR